MCVSFFALFPVPAGNFPGEALSFPDQILLHFCVGSQDRVFPPVLPGTGPFPIPLGSSFHLSMYFVQPRPTNALRALFFTPPFFPLAPSLVFSEFLASAVRLRRWG